MIHIASCADRLQNQGDRADMKKTVEGGTKGRYTTDIGNKDVRNDPNITPPPQTLLRIGSWQF